MKPVEGNLPYACVLVYIAARVILQLIDRNLLTVLLRTFLKRFLGKPAHHSWKRQSMDNQGRVRVLGCPPSPEDFSWYQQSCSTRLLSSSISLVLPSNKF